MKKLCTIAFVAIMTLAFAAAAYATVDITTTQPQIDNCSTAQRPSSISINIRSDVDFPDGATYLPAANASYYYVYYQFLRNVTLAESIGDIQYDINLNPIGALGTCDMTNVIDAEFEELIMDGTTAGIKTDPTAESENSQVPTVCTNPLTVATGPNHLEVSGSVRGFPDVALPGYILQNMQVIWGVFGLQGQNFCILRVPVPESNNMTDTIPPVRITVKNLCLNFANSAYCLDSRFNEPETIVYGTIAMSDPDVLLDHYPTSADRNDEIANFAPSPYPIAITGTSVIPNPILTICTKSQQSLICGGTTGLQFNATDGWLVPVCSVDEQGECETYHACAVLQMDDCSPFTLNLNELVLTPTTGIYMTGISIYENVGVSCTNPQFQLISPVSIVAGTFQYPGTCATTGGQTAVLQFNSTGARQLVICFGFQVNADELPIGADLNFAATLSTNVGATSCAGGKTFEFFGKWGTSISCVGGTLWFPYVPLKKAGWLAAWTVANLNPAATPLAAMRMDVTLYDMNGNVYAATDYAPGAIVVEKSLEMSDVDAIFGAGTYASLPTGAGWLKVEPNFEADGFIFYLDVTDGLGAGTNARLSAEF